MKPIPWVDLRFPLGTLGPQTEDDTLESCFTKPAVQQVPKKCWCFCFSYLAGDRRSCWVESLRQGQDVAGEFPHDFTRSDHCVGHLKRASSTCERDRSAIEQECSPGQTTQESRRFVALDFHMRLLVYVEHYQLVS